MKVTFLRNSRVQAVLVVLGLTAIVAILVVAGVFFRDRQRIDRWAANNGYDVVNCQKVSDGILNVDERQTWTIYQVDLKERLTGQARTTWIQLGPGVTFKQIWRREDL